MGIFFKEISKPSDSSEDKLAPLLLTGLLLHVQVLDSAIVRIGTTSSAGSEDPADEGLSSSANLPVTCIKYYKMEASFYTLIRDP